MIKDSNRKQNIKRRAAFLVCLLLTVAWMGAIFGFSSSDAEESTMQSNKVTEIILRIFKSDFDELTPEHQQSLIDDFDRITRKLAHFTAYATLGFFAVMTAFLSPPAKNAAKYIPVLCAFAFCFVFSLTDEYHQTLVEGRAGQLTDVLIDSSGALFGILIAAGKPRG